MVYMAKAIKQSIQKVGVPAAQKVKSVSGRPLKNRKREHP
jgi:hypothetical protein